jgi:hypothetical protein
LETLADFRDFTFWLMPGGVQFRAKRFFAHNSLAVIAIQWTESGGVYQVWNCGAARHLCVRISGTDMR